MNKPSKGLCAAVMAAALAAAAAPSALATPSHSMSAKGASQKIENVTFVALTFLNGQDTTYHPYVEDPGSACRYQADTGRDWMQMPGLTVAGPGPSDSSGGTAFSHVGTFDANVTGGSGQFLDFFYPQLEQAASEIIFYLPELQWPDGSWHYPTSTNGDYQWMMANSHAGPGQGSSDDSWEYLRNGQWGYPQFDGGPGGSDVAPGYGADWEWDSMFMDGGPGVYHMGGFLSFQPYKDFPGETVVFQSQYGVDSSQCTNFGKRLPPKLVSHSTISAPTQEALTAKIMRSSRTIQSTAKIHMFSLRHTHARSGRFLLASAIATSSWHHPKSHIVHRGRVICKAKIGKRISRHNHHHLLKPRRTPVLHRLHHRVGANMCLWKLPRHTKGKMVSYAVRLRTRHHSAVYYDNHRIR